MRCDLLVEPLISMRGEDGVVAGHTLPGVLAALARGEVFGDFPAVQAHQTHPWYAFLVQLATIALHAAGEREAPGAADDWREMLLALTDGERAPWCLVVDDPARPALLQPPAPDLATFKSRLSHPDELDILITSKNHDVKALRVSHPRPEHWLFALVTLQTMQGYPGRHYYGIARMNGGLGNRPAVGHQPSLGWGARFRRDVEALIEGRDRIVERYGYPDDGGHALLWVLPWDRKSSLAMGELDPLFIEVCQAVRLVMGADGIEARKTTQDAARVDAKAMNGRMGDPWTPIDRVESKSLTLSSAGFDYGKMVELILGERYEAGVLGERLDSDPGALWFSGWALVRGQGKTEGLHARQVVVPGELRGLFGTSDGREALAKAAKGRVELAGEVRTKLLAPSLGRLRGDGGNSKSEVIANFAAQCTARFEARVDDRFFPALWEDAKAERLDDARWRFELVKIATDIFEAALEQAPLPAARRFRAIADAEARFYGWARKFCPAFYERRQAAADDTAAMEEASDA